jgi:hypothetical protein
LKKRSLVICALAALVTAGVLAGCGNNFYFAGRVLPPSGIANRVLIAIQNPGVASKGLLQFVDAFYDIRQSFNDKIPGFSISGYSGALPITIQNMPEEQIGAVYGSGDGSFTLINYAKEMTSGAAASFPGLSSSVFIARTGAYAISASEQAQVLTLWLIVGLARGTIDSRGRSDCPRATLSDQLPPLGAPFTGRPLLSGTGPLGEPGIGVIKYGNASVKKLELTRAPSVKGRPPESAWLGVPKPNVPA